MRFVNNLNSLGPDDTYFLDQASPLTPVTVPTGAIGLVGTFSRGPIGKPIACYSYNDVVRNFGEVDTAFTLTGTVEARNIYRQGNTAVYIVRVEATGSPAAFATVTVNDSQPTPAAVFELQAFTPGTWGDAIIITVSKGTVGTSFKVQLQYGTQSETWDNIVMSSPATGQVTFASVFGTPSAPGKSQLATGVATPPAANSNQPDFTKTWAFTGGTNGTTGIAATDYAGANNAGVKTGLFALDSAPINYVLCAGQTDPTLNTSIQTNVDTITANGGLPRKGIVTFPASTALSGLQALVAVFNDDRIFPCFLQQQIYDPISGQNQVVSPLGFYAGVLAQLNPWEVPGNKNIQGSLGLDPNVNIGPGDVQTINAAQVTAIGVEIPAGGIGIAGEFTSSQAGGDATLTYVREMKDFIDYSVFKASGKYVDKPITDTLMRNVSQAVDMVLDPLKNPKDPNLQGIKDYQIQCDTGNNPNSQQQTNVLICDYAVKLLNIDRWLVFRTQIGSGVVLTTTQQTAGAAPAA